MVPKSPDFASKSQISYYLTMLLKACQLQGEKLVTILWVIYMCWGVPIGEDLFVKTVLEEKVSQILEEGRRSLQILGAEHRHAAWVALKQSIWPRFEYWAQNCYPSQTLPVARGSANKHTGFQQVQGGNFWRYHGLQQISSAQFRTYSGPLLALWSGSGPSPEFRTFLVPLDI